MKRLCYIILSSLIELSLAFSSGILFDLLFFPRGQFPTFVEAFGQCIIIQFFIEKVLFGHICSSEWTLFRTLYKMPTANYINVRTCLTAVFLLNSLACNTLLLLETTLRRQLPRTLTRLTGTCRSNTCRK